MKNEESSLLNTPGAQKQSDPELDIRKNIPTSEKYLAKLRENGLKTHAEAYETVIKIYQSVQEAGGQALLVGGSVRDMVLEKDPKDFDVEIYGLEPDAVEEIISRFGKVDEAGKKFGVLKMMFAHGIVIDVSLPRRDSKSGPGHTGIKANADPSMSIEEAAKRRDFTINSMSADPLTGTIFDPFHGRKDLADRVLKVTDPASFGEDPVRVLRAMQFIARLDLTLDPDSVEIIKEAAPGLREEDKDRVNGEWKKLLLKGERPAAGLQAGIDLGIFSEMHSEFMPVVEKFQEPNHEHDKNAWIRTLASLDKAARIVRRENMETDPLSAESNQALTIMLATLCHELGQPEATWATKDGPPISYGHGRVSKELAQKFLGSLNVNKKSESKILKLIPTHIAPDKLFNYQLKTGKKLSDGVIRRLAMAIHPATISELVLVAEADHPEDEFPAGKWLLEKAQALGVAEGKPDSIITGEFLIQKFRKPGPHIGQIIKLADLLRDRRNYAQDEIESAINETENADEAIAKLKSLLK